MKSVIAVLAVSVLAACASQPAGLSINELETGRYQLTERRRLPIDFAGVQKNLFRHVELCGESYHFEMVPNESSFARVLWRPDGNAGWDRTVLLSLVLLHNRTINVKAYSYYAGQLERARKMMTAMMKPDSCEVDTSWENRMDDD